MGLASASVPHVTDKAYVVVPAARRLVDGETKCHHATLAFWSRPPRARGLLTEEDPLIGRSVACIAGTTQTADIDAAYNAFVARASLRSMRSGTAGALTRGQSDLALIGAVWNCDSTARFPTA